METQVDKMVNRFLGWKLPDGFAPDCGISFKRESDYEHPVYGRNKYNPIGTNLLSADQARAMFEYVLEVEGGIGVAPFPLVEMGFGKVEVGPGVRDGLPMLWFGNNGQGLGVVNENKGLAKDGETIVAFTFANLDGLIPIEEALAAIRKMLEEKVL